MTASVVIDTDIQAGGEETLGRTVPRRCIDYVGFSYTSGVGHRDQEGLDRTITANGRSVYVGRSCRWTWGVDRAAEECGAEVDVRHREISAGCGRNYRGP